MMKKWFLLSLAVALQCFAFSTPVTDGLIIHLDAGSITGLNDGDSVAHWADQATADAVNGDVFAASGWNAPIYQSSAFNGNAVVRMQGGDLLASSSLTLPNVNDGLTIFIIAQGDLSGDGAERIMQLGSKGGVGGKCFGVDFSTNTAGTDGGSGGRFNNGKSLVRVNNPITTGFHIAALQIDQGETYGALRYYVDDMTAEVFDNSANPSNIVALDASGNELTVGTGIGTNGAYYTSDDYQGDIAEILIYNAQLSQAQMQQVLDYLTAKYTIFQAWNPTPADETINQGVVNGSSLDVAFNWNTGMDPDNTSVPNPDITKHYFYINKGEPNFVNVTPQEISAGSPAQPTASTGPLALDFDSTYYWRVDEGINNSGPNDPNTLTGPAWVFDTLKSLPFISEDGDPEDMLSYPYTDTNYEGDAVFTCSFSSVNAVDVKWYRASDPNNVLVNSGDILIATDKTGETYISTLTISNVEAADEDAYYCSIELLVNPNQEPPTVSNSADLGVRRAVGYWPLDGNYLDISGEGHDADPNETPDPSQWIPGVDPTETGQALNTVPNLLVVADAGDWAVSAFTGQISVSAWVKWAGANGRWQGIVSNRVGPANGNFYIEIRVDNGNVQLNAPNFTELQAEPLPIGEWTHVMVTSGLDGHTIYFNGVIKAQRISGNTIAQSISPVTIGALQPDGVTGELLNPFNGVMDEIKTFNYSLSHSEVAKEYYEVMEIATCLDRPEYDISGPDGEPDCKVDLNDLAALAASWLTDGLCPGQACP